MLAGHKVELIVLDDASDPTTAGRNARKLVVEDKVDVLIGTSGVPGAMAIAAVARETQHAADLADAGHHPRPRRRLDRDRVAALPADGRGGGRAHEEVGRQDGGLHRLLGCARRPRLRLARQERRAAGIKVVANERYARSDSSVAGQVLKIISTQPDAVFAGNSGTPGALPYLALADRGYKGQIYGTHGLINADFVRVGGASIEGLQVPSGPVAGGRPAARQQPDQEGLDGLSQRLPEGQWIGAERRLLVLHLRRLPDC